ncbi:MAG: EAL domain-containing protein [Lachnospiraceae bacterium]|nr:EAL domain-containing protein [Lachnospiraceae bacterium]
MIYFEDLPLPADIKLGIDLFQGYYLQKPE